MNILETIVQSTKARIESKKREVSLERVRALAESRAKDPSGANVSNSGGANALNSAGSLGGDFNNAGVAKKSFESALRKRREMDAKNAESKNADSANLDSSAKSKAPESKLESKALMDSLITYHDPCHAKKVLKIHKEPRALLAKNHRLIEMSESDRCCGFGGVSMQSDRYALTLKAGAPKAQMIADTRANIVSAECSACRMQITNSLSHAGVNAKFAHPLELIAKALD